MNALLLLIILTYLIFHRWRGQNLLQRWIADTQHVLQCLEARRYIEAEEASSPLRAVFQQQIRSGRLQPQSMRSLLTWMRALERADAERLRVGSSAALRLSLGAAIGLGSSLILDGSWFLQIADNPPAVLLIGGYVLILFLWLRRLPAHPLATSTSLQAKLTSAWLGTSQDGPWHETWVKWEKQGRVTGRDVRYEQIQLLEDWLLQGTQEQEKRLTWAEELFGLVELASSVYFLGTACALPLLNLWGG